MLPVKNSKVVDDKEKQTPEDMRLVSSETDSTAARYGERIRQAHAHFPDLRVFHDRYLEGLPNPPDDPRWEGIELMGWPLPEYVLEYRASKEKEL